MMKPSCFSIFLIKVQLKLRIAGQVNSGHRREKQCPYSDFVVNFEKNQHKI